MLDDDGDGLTDGRVVMKFGVVAVAAVDGWPGRGVIKKETEAERVTERKKERKRLSSFFFSLGFILF